MKMCTEIKKNKIKKISVHTVSAENYNCFSLYKSLRLLGYSKMKLFDQASDISSVSSSSSAIWERVFPFSSFF